MPPATTELLLVRHAPTLAAGRLCGRSDVAADCTDTARFTRLRALLGPVDAILTSPALRCRQTAQALWPQEQDMPANPALWEQDFGAWENRPIAALPDLGPLSRAALAAHTPPQGESFLDMVARTGPALDTIGKHGGRIALIVHAGTIRCALAHALEAPESGLGFDIAPLSLTRILVPPAGQWAILSVNERTDGGQP